MHAALLALSLALVTASAPQEEDDGVPPIQDIGDAYLLQFAEDPQESLTLARFVAACEEATGINFTYTDETGTMLENQRIRLLGTKRVPKGEFYSFFQIMMIINEYVCTEIGEAPLSVVLIDSLRTQARSTIRGDALLVEPEDLDEYTNQPATLIMTVVTLPNTDVRQLSNSMRTMITDANTQQMLPAGNTDSMVLVGFGSNVAALAKMLRIVDDASKVQEVVPVFEVIPLEYTSAEEISGIIEELLDASRRANQNMRVQAQEGVSGQIARAQTEAKIMVHMHTNSLLVMAMPDDMPSIKELVARLDVDVIERERSYHIYNLKNVGSEELAETLNEFLQDANRLEAQRGQAAGGTVPQQQPGTTRSTGRSQEFVVVPDPETNSLLIAASRTRYQELLSLVQRLDQRQDQVLIETALIELSGRDFLDIGVELGLAEIPGTDEFGGFGVTSFGLSLIDDLDGDGVPDARIPNVTTGVTAGILDGDDFSLPVLLKLLQERRNSNVLNVPSVLVNNNGSATVKSQEEQPTTTVTLGGGVGGTGTQESFKEYVEAGITMQISPSISASSYLRLDIYLEVSNFIGAVQGSIPPPRVTRTIETQVNVPDGDTMVIGGIIIDNRTDTRSQVPLLGDIPLLGKLFSRNSESLDRTALYFFVTPHILQDAEFADLAEISYQKKLEAADTIGADRIRMVDPKFGSSDVGLEGFDVPIYSSPARGEVDQSDVGLDPLEINGMLDENRPTDPGSAPTSEEEQP